MRKILQTEDFLLGTFASNCSGGMTVTKLPERWAATWENNDQLGRLLDDAADRALDRLWRAAGAVRLERTQQEIFRLQNFTHSLSPLSASQTT